MMMSSNGNVFHVTDSLWGDSTGDRWIPLTKASGAELWCFLWSAWTNAWANTRDASDLRRHRAHYDVTVMYTIHIRNDIGATNNIWWGLSTFSIVIMLFGDCFMHNVCFMNEKKTLSIVMQPVVRTHQIRLPCCKIGCINVLNII